MLYYVMQYVCYASIKSINSCLGNINSKAIINIDITIHDNKYDRSMGPGTGMSLKGAVSSVSN
mgnify:CR=1 FL=1